MKQVLIRQGQAIVEEVPAPRLEQGTVLVSVANSCISTGTELSGVKSSGKSLWQRVIEDPNRIEKAVRMLADKGLSHTRSAIQGTFAGGAPTGYSVAGTVLEVGDGVDALRPGDRVACAGTQSAHHAEVVRVPHNLVARIPEGVAFAAASTVALGAIALQGVRRANPTLGETFVVIGLGFLGQLTSQFLSASGCRVIGTDLYTRRIQMARDLGMEMGLDPEGDDAVEQVQRLTNGIGADGVIVTAAASSSEIISSAFQMCRRKGRVVVVGDVGLDLKRADIYQKELDFFISTSYGPGRYDRRYEEDGIDYPVAYVRWTENRNMSEYLRLIASGKVNINPLIDTIYPIEQAGAAYDKLRSGEDWPLTVLLAYPESASEAARHPQIVHSIGRAGRSDKIRMAIVGAGEFARGVHLPNLLSLSEYFSPDAVVSRSGHNAAQTGKQFGAKYSTTDFVRVVEDPEIDAVLIATRHNLHASMVLAALESGKHVFVEKPLALTTHELADIKAFYEANTALQDAPVLLTGFNRRFSRYMRRVRELVRGRSDAMIINYRMNAGYLPIDHWVHTNEGGGRNLGEACHIYDLFTFLTGSKVSTVEARAITPRAGYFSYRDNFVMVASFEDGSVATLTYTSLGAKEHPKEQMELFVDGKVIVLNDYRLLTVAGGKTKGLESKAAEKGHRETLEAFGQVIREGGEWPIPLWQQVQATEIALTVETLLPGHEPLVS